MKPYTRIGIRVDTYENLKKYAKEHADEVRKRLDLDGTKHVSVSDTVDYLLYQIVRKQSL